jgi:membrane fusion protein, multidrug efflux system
MKTINICIIAIALVINGCKTVVNENTASETLQVRVSPVSQEKVTVPIHSTGTLAASEEMKLSFKTGGIIAEIFVSEGSQVKKGDILASLNLSEIAAQVSQAENGYEKTLRDFDRAKNLYNDSVATLEQMQNAETALSVAKSTLQIAEFNLSHSKITAPEKGVILKQFVEKNELIAPGYPVFYFGTAGSSWKVKTSLSDRDIIRINAGDSAIVSIDPYPGVDFKAVVTQVGESANPMTGTYEIELKLNDTSHRFASGFIANVELYPALNETFWMVPVESVVEDDGPVAYVYTITDSLTAKKIKVDIAMIYGSQVAVSGGLEGVSGIVTEGAAYLTDGDRIEIIK